MNMNEFFCLRVSLDQVLGNPEIVGGAISLSRARLDRLAGETKRVREDIDGLFT